MSNPYATTGSSFNDYRTKDMLPDARTMVPQKREKNMERQSSLGSLAPVAEKPSSTFDSLRESVTNMFKGGKRRTAHKKRRTY